jgi:acetate kinase
MKNKSIYIAVNAGSSSLKFKLYSMPDETLICFGMADRIGQKMGSFSLKDRKSTRLNSSHTRLPP